MPKEKSDYPLILTVEEVKEILCIKKAAAYDLMDQKDFPCIKIGRLKRVPRDHFFDWIDRTALNKNRVDS